MTEAKEYQLKEIPTGYARVVTLGEENVDVDELIVKMANALIKAGLLK